MLTVILGLRVGLPALLPGTLRISILTVSVNGGLSIAPWTEWKADWLAEIDGCKKSGPHVRNCMLYAG